MIRVPFLLSLLFGQSAPPPVVVSPASTRTLLSWMPGEPRCEGGAAPGIDRMRRPWNSLSWSAMSNIRPVTYRFAIDASGRPLSITRDGSVPGFSSDIAPALAASRFRPGARRTGCSITYTPLSRPFGDALVADLVSYTITPMGGQLPREGWDRIRRPGNCADMPRPAPLVRAYPDFGKLSRTPGVKDWALVAYDTDPTGRPLNVRVTETTGNAALDEASARAIAQSRFAGGARTGCVYPYWLNAGRLPAPPMPDDDFTPAGSTCPRDREWAKAPTLTFPEPYRRRLIEGWAIVSYDTAPWGEIGNVKVLRAEPSEDFGEQAIQVVRSARVAASPQGSTGCIGRVRFVMGSDATPPADGGPPPFY